MNMKNHDRIDVIEFEEKYILYKDITLEKYRRNYVTLPCNCEEGCEGLAAIMRQDHFIIDHVSFYMSD